MSSTSKKLKLVIKEAVREVVRDEVRSALREALTGLKTPKVQENSPGRKQNSYPTQKQSLSNNKVINEVLNDTLMDEGWKNMGGGDGIYDSNNMNDIISREYSNTGQTTIPQNPANRMREMGIENTEAVPSEVVDNIFNKDYGALMKAIDKKKGG